MKISDNTYALLMVGVFTAGLFAADVVSPTKRTQAVEWKPGPAPEDDHVWHMQPMTSGPAVYWTCFHGDRVYAFQKLHSRGKHGLWPGASISVSPGGCE